MKAGYSDLTVSPTPGTNRIELEATLCNDSRETWSSQQGDAVSYQILDALTETPIVDGPRTPFAVPALPQSEVELKTSIELPSEAGAYRIYFSPLREGVAWWFDRGSPFVAIDVEVADGEVRVVGYRVTTMNKLRLSRLTRSSGRAFVYPLRTIMQHRSLIRSMVRRDIVGRYRGSYGGLFWTVFHPLLMMLTYYFVFGIVLQTRFPQDDRPSSFALYFLAGMLPWLAFSEAVGRAPGVVVEHSNFVRKLLFPVETLPVSLVFAGLFGEVFGVGVFLLALAFFGYTLPLTVVFLPLVLIPQLLFTLGLCWFLAALGVFFRDIGQVIGFLLTVWFFVTPICYPETFLQNYRWLYESNPMYILVKSYRLIFLDASEPLWQPLGVLTIASIGVFVVGHAWFYKLKNSFADLV